LSASPSLAAQWNASTVGTNAQRSRKNQLDIGVPPHFCKGFSFLERPNAQNPPDRPNILIPPEALCHRPRSSTRLALLSIAALRHAHDLAVTRSRTGGLMQPVDFPEELVGLHFLQTRRAEWRFPLRCECEECDHVI
jgi:hypothetical protein